MLAHRAATAASLLLGLVTATPAAGGSPPAGVEREIERLNARPDQPDAAAEMSRLKRQPLDPSVDPVAALASARERLARMPLHSSRFGGFLPAWVGPSPQDKAIRAALRALGTWEPLGPGNIGGRIRGFVIDPADPRTMYAAGVSGGVFKTTDGGGTWRPLDDLMANLAVCSLAIHPQDPRTLYAGTGEGYYRETVRGTGLPLRGAGVFRTTDAGASWSRLPSTAGEDFHWVNDLVLSPTDGDRLYAATRTGVWRTTDAGGTWRRVLDPEVNGGCLDLVIRSDSPGDVLLAACGTLSGQAAVFRSLDAGGEGAWETVLTEPGMGRTSLALAPSDQDVVYALSASNSGGPGGRYNQGLHALYRSTSGGAASSWSARIRNTAVDPLATLILTNPAAASYVQCGWSTSNRWVNMGWYTNVVAVDPVDPDVVWAGGVDLFRSDDGGLTWGLASYWWLEPGFDTFVHADQHAIVFHPDYDGSGNRTLLVANDGGVFVTADARAPVARGPDAVCDPYAAGTNWTPLNHDLGVTQFYHGAPWPGGDRYLGGTQDNGTIVGSDVGGSNGWTQVIGGDGGYVAVDPGSPDFVYACWQYFNFNRSTDGGATFQLARTGLEDDVFLFIAPFAMDPGQPSRLWTGGRRVWRTDNRASTWTAASAYLAGSGSVSAVAVSPADPERVVVGTADGWIARTDQALTTGAATSWPAVRPREGFVTWVAFHPSDPSMVYATYGGFGGHHVWRSTDGGATWSPHDGEGGLAVPDLPVHCLVVDPTHPARLYLGTDLGVLVSLDGGASWAVENSGFANVVTESLALTVDASGRELLFAFTHGRGAWRVALEPRTPEPRHPRGRWR